MGKRDEKVAKAKKPFFKKWWFWLIIVILIIGVTGGSNKTKKTTQDKNIKVEKKVNKDSSKTKTSNVKTNKKIDLTSKGEFQFDSVNIKPVELIREKYGKVIFNFDWRNDYGLSDESSYNGVGVVIQMFQDGQELPDNYEEMINNTKSDLYFKIKKNTSLTVGFEYILKNEKSDVTVKMTPLEGDSKEFVISLD